MIEGRFRRKPLVVEAVRCDRALRAAKDAWQELPQWLRDEYERGNIVFLSDAVTVATKDGVMRAEPGDWLIREPFPTDDRRVYPCKPAIFETGYEPVERDDPLTIAHRGLLRALDFKAGTANGLSIKQDVLLALYRSGFEGEVGVGDEGAFRRGQTATDALHLILSGPADPAMNDPGWYRGVAMSALDALGELPEPSDAIDVGVTPAEVEGAGAMGMDAGIEVGGTTHRPPSQFPRPEMQEIGESADKAPDA